MAYTDRTADYVITRAYIHAKQKGTPPTTGDDKYTVMLGALDSIQKDLTAEDIEWDWLYEVVSNGTVTATDTFDLDDSIEYISKREGDYITLVSPDKTQTVTYTLVRPDQLYGFRYGNYVAQINRTLKFSKPFKSTDTTIGYTIRVPAIVYVDDLTSGSSIIQCSNPQYLVYMLAAETIRSDVTRKDQYDNLLNLASNIMEKMRSSNSGQYEEIARPFQPEGANYL